MEFVGVWKVGPESVLWWCCVSDCDCDCERGF